jgi:hypothetical protein
VLLFGLHVMMSRISLPVRFSVTFAEKITNLTEGGLVGSYLAVANNTGLIAAPSQSRVSWLIWDFP